MLSPLEKTEILTNKKENKILNRNGYSEIRSGFWYEKAENWYAITAFANATRTVYKELQILIQNQEEIINLLGDGLKIFYGIGNGDTESLLIDWDLKRKNYSEIIAIDTNRTFIRNFIFGLKSLITEYQKPKIMILPMNMFFENIKNSDLIPSNRKTKNSIHICLGNTIGNFETHEIFNIFSKNMHNGNLLLIGCQLLENNEKHLRQYSESPLYDKWTKDIVGDNKTEIGWRWNDKESRVEAWNGNTIVFKSKRFTINELRSVSSNFGLENIKDYELKNSLISIFKKS